MKPTLILLLSCMMSIQGIAQRYADSIKIYRNHYKEEFLTDTHSPLKAEDTGYLRFFKPDIHYRVLAQVVLNEDIVSFNIPTHSGKLKRFRRYGLVSFKLQGQKKTTTLELYQNCDLSKQEQYKDLLFLPFNDATNYITTYAGGRYLDFSIQDIHDGKLLIDFNKAYNPYCAYADGYNCPIPPTANRIPYAIKAGEQLFGKKRD